MNSEIYPNLYKKYEQKYSASLGESYEEEKNIDVIIDAIKAHFGDLFNLDVLEDQAKQNNTDGSYYALFQRCLNPLEGLHTEGEVISALHQFFHTKTNRDEWLLHYTMVPKIGTQQQRQIGYFEKMATGQLGYAEPLSFLDMFRVIRGIKQLNESRVDVSNFAVVHLAHLSHLDRRSIDALKQKYAVFVNFNPDVKGTPQWGVLDLSRGFAASRVFCEMPLLDGHKRTLEDIFDIPACTYEGATARSLQSTGYTAVTWLDANITKAWQCNTEGDFGSLLYDVSILMKAGDTQALAYTHVPEEASALFSSAFKYFRKLGNGGDNFTGDFASSLISVNRGSVRGVYKSSAPFKSGDVSKMIEAVYDARDKLRDVEDMRTEATRTLIPGFATTLEETSLSGTKLIIKQIDQETQKVVSTVLSVPNHIDIDELKGAHARCARQRNINSGWLRSAIADAGVYRQQSEAATLIVYAFVRAEAKSPVLTINMPRSYCIASSDIDVMVRILDQNAFVTEFNVGDNPSLRNMKTRLEPTFARNRWLHSRGYLPPLADDYWKRAAKEWLLHLRDEPDVLLPKEENNLFKTCVREMGQQGLNAILEVLKDEAEAEWLAKTYGRNKPAFYLGCANKTQYNDYLDTFVRHLDANYSFPFSEVGIAYHSSRHNRKLVEVLNALNEKNDFEQVTLTNCLDNPDDFADFLRDLIAEAKHSNWQGVVIIPELQGNTVLPDRLHFLRSQSRLLNNIILRNKRLNKSREALDEIKEQSHFPADLAVGGAASLVDDGEGKEDELEDEPAVDIGQLAAGIAALGVNAKWPFQKGGDVQLQLQQQQEIQQQRQIQQEKQRVVHRINEEAIAGQLVDYDNIGRLLGDYWTQFKDENPYHLTAARLADDFTENELQGFFHTWINANPAVHDAAHVIQKMTPAAAKMLLRKHVHLSSGLNPENLPKGFFTQRSKDDELVLCYDPELSYVATPTAFTLDLDVRRLPAVAWEGDFRQFDIETYLDDDALQLLEGKVWQDMLLFAKLQPVKASYQDEYDAFYAEQGYRLRATLTMNKAKIIQNWPVFIQCFNYAGQTGVTQFLAKDVHDFSFDEDDVSAFLFERQSHALQDFARYQFSEAELRAMGQIYYQYGDAGLTLFLTKMQQLDTTLGTDFFEAFMTHFLEKTDNFNVFMSVSCFEALDSMIEKLAPPTANAEQNKQAFRDVMRHHMASVDWEHVAKIWGAFDSFVSDMNQLSGAELLGDEFSQIKSENMLVCMDRILGSLEQLTEDAQKVFLKNLHSLDLTHGGVHYALQKEGFQNIHPSLELHDFDEGKPTYAADLKRLYTQGFDVLQMKRALAASSKFKPSAFDVLVPRFEACDKPSKDNLMWLLNTRYTVLDDDIGAVLDSIETVDGGVKAVIAEHLQYAVYTKGHRHLAISLEAILDARAFLPAIADLRALLNRHPNGTFLEALSILKEAKGFTRGGREIEALIRLFESGLMKPENCSELLSCQAYKLAVLFDAVDEAKIRAFYERMEDLKPVVKQELNLLMMQLLSADCAASDKSALSADKFDALIECMTEMHLKPAQTSMCRLALLDTFEEAGIEFKYSKNGAFRAVRDDEEPVALKVFTDHKARLWRFIQGHIAVPAEGNTAEELGPIIRFLKTLQLNRTYLNEIEPLLASLEEKTPDNMYWSASYFSGLLQALQPENDKISFPISLLKVILEERAIRARSIDEVEEAFPDDLVEPFQTILKSTDFDRRQQAKLCQIALKEFDERGNIALLFNVIELLSNETYEDSRGYALEMLGNTKTMHGLEQQLDNCRWLLQHPNRAEVKPHWREVSALWLKALSGVNNEQTLFNTIKGTYESDPDKQALILHIIAYSSLRVGLNDINVRAYELNKKAPKLVEQLGEMSDEDLLALAACYPNQPSPGLDDVRRMIKKYRAEEEVTWTECLDAFARTPYPEPRADYAAVSLTRDADLQRMIAETRISAHEQKQSFSAQTSADLTFIFMCLKGFERGEVAINGSDKPISEMSQQELADAFQDLSEQSQDAPNDMVLKAQVWAVLFEVLGRTTRKYPHLAQQFALIANDMGVNADTRVLQLATGEGKSHFVAMRAARHAGQGKRVDVCTAKRTLAARDLEDYQDLFDYLNLKTAYIHPKSDRDTYMDAHICYSTLGDLSLFLDEQCYSGHPIEIAPENRVALFDEFDFIRFEEGRKTEYNYARPTGKTPKQMTWFYQAVNRFYKEQQFSGGVSEAGNVIARKAEITVDILSDFAVYLTQAVAGNEERETMLPQLIRDPLQMVQWLQSAREAADLEWGSGFTVRDLNIAVGDELYPMREVIPVSSDNQPMHDSTFSAGVHQLLAVRLNTEAEASHKPQNFHIHPESNIISSQVAPRLMKTLWRTWEGFSGTISAAQAKTLNQDHGTEVLHVPTNQRDLRCWHKPEFYGSAKERNKRLVQQIRECLAKKQSILFSCKDDKHVNALQEVLAAELTSAELEQFIFYTNEESRTAAEVLKDKHEAEQWHGGKKQRAMGLVASGFGRGDNVDVEAVFLFDVNDNNDKLQKGGRTARNGAEGEVFQFYLSTGLAQEEARLMNGLPAPHEEEEEEEEDLDWPVSHIFDEDDEAATEDSNTQSIVSVRENLGQVAGDSEAEKQFERVMLLREYLFSAQNAANQGYRSAVAEFSAWGMSCLGKLEDPTERSAFTLKFSAHLKKLDKAWIDILSQQDVEVDDKIGGIRAAIEDEAAHFSADLTEDEHVFAELKLSGQQAVHIELVVPPPPRQSTPEEKAIATICGVMARLPDSDIMNPALQDIPSQLGSIAEANHGKLLQLAEKVVTCQTFEAFSDAVGLCLRQAQNPSIHDKTIVGSAIASVDAEIFLNMVADTTLKLQYAKVMDAFEPMLQTDITEALMANSLQGFDVRHRIEEAMPILQYLAQFDKAQQERWGEGYIRELIDVSLSSRHQAVLTKHLTGAGHEAPISMGYSHFHALWQMAENVTGDLSFDDLFVLLERAVKEDPENRLRMLTKWESWAKALPEAERQAFLISFCKTMEQFKEGNDWDVFVALVNKTQTWWNKFNQDAYRDEIVSLWDKFGAYGAAVTKVTDFINLGVKPDGILGGKSWFQVLHIGFDGLTSERLEAHGQQLEKLWVKVDQDGGKKSVRTTHFTECCEGLNHTYDLIDCLETTELKGVSTSALQGLDGGRIESMTLFAREEHAFVKDHISVLPFTLSYMADTTVPVARAERIRDVYIDWVRDEEIESDDLKQLIATFQAVRPIDEVTSNLFADLDDTRFEKVMALTEEHKHLFAKYPELHAKMLEYSQDDTISETCFEHLSELLLESGRFHDDHAAISTEHLMVGVERFRDKPEAVLQATRDLFADKVSEQPLFDDAAEHLTLPQYATERESVLGVMKMFYAARGKTRTSTTKMHMDKDIHACFTFDVNESSKTREKRVTLMHLLDQGVFCEDIKDTDDADVTHRWDTAHNNVLLDTSYGRYVAHTNKVLKAPSASPKLGKVRDLTTSQQCDLLKLTDEFQVIGEQYARPLRTVEAVKAQVSTLKASLGQLSKNYQASWFKSTERKDQVQLLDGRLGLKLDKLTAKDQRASAPYELVLIELYKAKEAAIASDYGLNSNRLFKMNRGGRSRYFNTLNQMQDAVLRQWTQDLDAAQRFNVYKQHHSKEFAMLLGGLDKAVIFHVSTPGRMSSLDTRYHNVFNRIGRFLGLLTDERAVDDLKKALDAFTTIPKGIDSADAVKALRESLKAIEPRLPGHLKTLAKELLVRGDALESSLEAQPEFTEIRKTLACAAG
ncbi:MAG: hypothetical protein K0U37_00310 [Gammaproteobacteria bacterium]|nr:hypothetical protein [Gammaproteobacteria bacterium]